MSYIGDMRKIVGHAPIMAVSAMASIAPSLNSNSTLSMAKEV